MVISHMLKQISAYESKHMTLSDMIQHVRLNGGLSYQPVLSLIPLRNYMVSLPGYERAYPLSSVTAADLDTYVKEHISLFKNRNHFLGIWIKDETGEIYFDISVNVAYLKTAIRKGIEGNQYSIFDLNTGNSIDLRDANGNYLRDSGKPTAM